MLLIAKSCVRPALFLVAFALLAIGAFTFPVVDAQSTRPTLISHADSTRAIAFESVTRQREPFTTSVQVRFGSDSATRLMLFAMNLKLQAGETATAVTADAEDANHTIHQLTVEHVGTVPDQPWTTSIILRLAEALPETGDVLVRIKYRGVESNRVRVGLGQVGGGPPDDPNSGPTPGIIGPPSSTGNSSH